MIVVHYLRVLLSSSMQGPAGPTGPAGPMGPTGPQGSSGQAGAPGFPGSDGAAGVPGNPGNDGQTGSKGEKVRNWPLAKYAVLGPSLLSSIECSTLLPGDKDRSVEERPGWDFTKHSIPMYTL